MNLSALRLTEPLRALTMPDEYTFAVAKAALVVASTIGLVLYLAWVAATKCFREAGDVAVHESVSRPARQAVEQPGISLTVAPSGSLRNLRRRFELLRIFVVDILSAGRGLLNEGRLLRRLFKAYRWAIEFSDGTTSKMKLPPRDQAV
jgi:hypothetical protein